VSMFPKGLREFYIDKTGNLRGRMGAPKRGRQRTGQDLSLVTNTPPRRIGAFGYRRASRPRFTLIGASYKL